MGFSVQSCLSTDRDFEPPCEEEDDEETIEVEEQQDGNDAESHQREIELLKEESLVPLDQLLSTLNLPQVLPQLLSWLLSMNFNCSTLMVFTLNVRSLCHMDASSLYIFYFKVYTSHNKWQADSPDRVCGEK